MTASIQPSGDLWAILLEGVPVASDHDQESAQTVADLMNQGLRASVAQASALVGEDRAGPHREEDRGREGRARGHPRPHHGASAGGEESLACSG
jgi:hypothetical protein